MVKETDTFHIFTFDGPEITLKRKQLFNNLEKILFSSLRDYDLAQLLFLVLISTHYDNILQHLVPFHHSLQIFTQKNL